MSIQLLTPSQIADLPIAKVRVWLQPLHLGTVFVDATPANHSTDQHEFSYIIGEIDYLISEALTCDKPLFVEKRSLYQAELIWQRDQLEDVRSVMHEEP